MEFENMVLRVVTWIGALVMAICCGPLILVEYLDRIKIGETPTQMALGFTIFATVGTAVGAVITAGVPLIGVPWFLICLLCALEFLRAYNGKAFLLPSLLRHSK